MLVVYDSPRICSCDSFIANLQIGQGDLAMVLNPQMEGLDWC